jgi:hypothetical protein
MPPEREGLLKPWTLVRAALCIVSLGIIVTRPFTHDILVTVTTCVVLGVLVGVLLRLYIEMRR